MKILKTLPDVADVPKTRFRCAGLLADMEAAHTTLQKLRVEARADERRSDAQQYANTQWLIREAMKVERRNSANAKRPATADNNQPQHPK